MVVAVLVAFTVWCGWVLHDVGDARAQLERRVDWTSRLSAVGRSLRETGDAGELASLDRDAFELMREVVEAEGSDDVVSLALTRATLELRSSMSATAQAQEHRVAAMGAIDDAVAALRRKNGATSAHLSERWGDLRIIALGAILVAGVAMALFGYVAVVAVPRTTAQVRRIEQLAQRMGELQATGRLFGHELGGPLTMVLTNLELLQQRARNGADEEGQRLIDEALHALGRANVTLQDLRKSSDGASDEANEADVRIALAGAVAIAREQAGAPRIEVETGAVPSVRVPEEEVRRMLAQLFEAALAKPERDRVITVAARDVGTHVAIEFGVPASCGPALAPARLADAAAAVGGRFSFEARGNDGVARLELPVESKRSREAPAPAVPVAVPGAAPIVAAPAAPRLRVLLIDDDELVVASVKRVLAQHAVEAELDSNVAAARVLAGDFDVVLCDVMMPGTSGLDIFREVQRARPDLAARFVFMSGGAIDERIDRFLAEQAPARIDKPFTSDALRRLVAARGAAAK
ncbi:MAG: response regulator [Nannocystaceae bacterium]